MTLLLSTYRYVVDTTRGYSVELERKNKMRNPDHDDLEKLATRLSVKWGDVREILLVADELHDSGIPERQHSMSLYACPELQSERNAEEEQRHEAERRDYAYLDREWRTGDLAKHVHDTLETTRYYMAQLERSLARFEGYDDNLHDPTWAEDDHNLEGYIANVGEDLAEALVEYLENLARNSNARYAVKDARRYDGGVLEWFGQMKFYTQPLPDDELGGSFDHALALVDDLSLYGWDLTLPDDDQGTDEHLPRYMGPDLPHIAPHWYGWTESRHFRPPLKNY